MATLKTTLEGSLRYKGKEGQLSFWLHRISGIGTILFLAIHILDTSTVYFFPSFYEHGIALYRSTPFMIGEIILVYLILFHGVNGLRIAFFDLFPKFWAEKPQRTSVHWIIAVSFILWLPAAYIMGRNLIVHNFMGG